MASNNIGSARRAYAKKNGDFTQKNAAEYFGVSLGTYRNWEQGRTGLSLGQLSAIAEKYEVTVDYLLCREQQKPKKVDYLTAQELELLGIMRSITTDGQAQMLVFARGLLATYPKNNQVSQVS